MKVLIISDTHGDDSGIATIRKKEGPGSFDVLIHAGDSAGSDSWYAAWARSFARGGFHIVCGNDYCSTAPTEETFLLDRSTVFLTHGHRYGLYGGIGTLVSAAAAKGAGIVIFGHTHEPVIEYRDGILVLNPGSLSLPRQPDRRKTYIVLTIDDSDHSLHPVLHWL
ncbi:MAG: metallophosphoesterase [Lachnospiraceae bacterium]|jgi:putative phosphoesterase|nr:metallophosphoesterase [Lachnospiraceae bacterium]